MTMPQIPMPKIVPAVFDAVNKGLFLDRAPHKVPNGGLTGCYNVRIKEGRIENKHMGWEQFITDDNIMPGPIQLVDNFFTTSGAQTLILGCPGFLARYAPGTPDKLVFINPTYSAPGTIETTGLDEFVTGSGTTWQSGTPNSPGATDPVKVGDWIVLDSTDQDVNQTWHEVTAVNSDTELEVTPDPAEHVAGTTWLVVQTFTNDEAELWNGDIFYDAHAVEDRYYACNGIGRQVVHWNGSDASVTMIQDADTGTLGLTCDIIQRYKSMALYGRFLDVSTGQIWPGGIWNSALGEPETVVGKEASQWYITDGVDDLLALEPLGDYMVGYCERSVNIAQFIGYPVLFVARTAVNDVGTLSGRSIANIGDYHDFAGDDRGYRFDGVSLGEMGQQVFREILRTIAPDRRYQTIVHIDEEQGDIHFVVPQNGDRSGESPAPDIVTPENSYTAHYLENLGPRDPYPFTYRRLSATAFGYYQRSSALTFDDIDETFEDYSFAWNDRFYSAQFPYNLFGDVDGRIWIMGNTDKQTRLVGAEWVDDYDAWCRLPRITLGDGERKGFVHTIEPHAMRNLAGHQLGVILWLADRQDGELTRACQEWYDLSHQEGDARYVGVRCEGRYGEVEFATALANQTWSLSGYTIRVSAGGER